MIDLVCKEYIYIYYIYILYILYIYIYYIHYMYYIYYMCFIYIYIYYIYSSDIPLDFHESILGVPLKYSMYCLAGINTK